MVLTGLRLVLVQLQLQKVLMESTGHTQDKIPLVVVDTESRGMVLTGLRLVVVQLKLQQVLMALIGLVEVHPLVEMCGESRGMALIGLQLVLLVLLVLA